MRKALVSGIALITLAGCTAPLEELSRAEPSGTTFTKALSKEYLDFAKSEAAQYDWIDSQLFAEKGLAAARGVVVLPESPANWRISRGPGPAALEDDRLRLLAALDAGGRDRAPTAAARAQSGYDCWLEQLEEGWQTDDIETCRKKFQDNLVQLQAAPAAAPVAAMPAAVPPATGEGFQVYFDFGSVAVGSLGMSIVEEAAAQAKRAGVRRIVVTGHADSVGSAQSNLVVSARRAEAVKRALVAYGVDAGRIDTLAMGETEPMVRTPDETREAHNRRVVIRFH